MLSKTCFSSIDTQDTRLLSRFHGIFSLILLYRLNMPPKKKAGKDDKKGKQAQPEEKPSTPEPTEKELLLAKE